VLDHPLVHEDPLALRIISRADAETLRMNPDRFERGQLAPLLRAFLAVRSRAAEDEVSRAVSRGVRQYVVLGAGLDTFAYRNPHAGLRVLELDFPATQAWKRELLATNGIAVPSDMTFAGVDFDREPLPDALRAAGVDPDRPTFFSWLGVTPYLEPDTVLRTLADLGPFARGGGGVVFDYTIPPDSLPLLQRAAFELLAKRVRDAGEPFRGFFEPAALGDGRIPVQDLCPLPRRRSVRTRRHRTRASLPGSTRHRPGRTVSRISRAGSISTAIELRRGLGLDQELVAIARPRSARFG